MNKVAKPVWERSHSYRKLFFKHNLGIFYTWYFCPYCRKKFNRKEITQVDHIIAVNAVKHKWYFQLWFAILGKNVNDPMNLVAACRHCNLVKKDKHDLKIILRGSTGAVYHHLMQATSILLIRLLDKYWFPVCLVLGLLGIWCILTIRG